VSEAAIERGIQLLAEAIRCGAEPQSRRDARAGQPGPRRP
jgi:hypothetical protein